MMTIFTTTLSKTLSIGLNTLGIAMIKVIQMVVQMTIHSLILTNVLLMKYLAILKGLRHKMTLQ